MSSPVNALHLLRENDPSEEQKRKLVPVSRISFALTDTNAFDKAARFAVDWLASKIGGTLPPEALALNNFDTRRIEGYHPCHAVRIDDVQGSVWAAQIDEPGSQPLAGETWSTELFVERRANTLVRFGAQLMVRQPVNSPLFRPSRPRLVHELLADLSAEVDGEPITEGVARLTAAEVVGLRDLVYRPERRLPIVMVSTDNNGVAQVDLQSLARRLSGATHLIAIDPEASWELTRLLGKRMSTFNGALRVYMPGIVDEEEDPFQHPLWLAPTSGRNARLIDTLANRIFPMGFRDSDEGSRFWHLAQLRQVASAAAVRSSIGSPTDQLRSKVAALDDEIFKLKDTLETAAALEAIATANEKSAQHEVEQLKSENSRLRATLYRLQQAQAEQGGTVAKPADRPLKDYDDLEDWADEVLGPHIVLHRRALKDCRQNGHPDMLDRIADTLLVIRDYWVPSKLEGGLERREAASCALSALGVEDEACFARREKARHRPEYSVRDGSVTRILYDHFKYGNSRSNSEQFRIYYSWDDEAKQLHIGKMPSHLPNDQS